MERTKKRSKEKWNESELLRNRQKERIILQVKETEEVNLDEEERERRKAETGKAKWTCNNKQMPEETMNIGLVNFLVGIRFARM